MIISRTPFRISFFGGGTDYPAWYKENGGAVLSASIDKYCYLTCRYLPPFFEHKTRVVWSKIETVAQTEEIQHPAIRETIKFLGIQDGLQIHHDADLPARSGIGSSSSFTVGLLNSLYTLLGKSPTKTQLALEAIHVEQELVKENVGSQDQSAAAFGGFNKIEFGGPDHIRVTPIGISQADLDALQSHLMLFFTGFARNASEIAAEQIRLTSQKAKELKIMYSMVNTAEELLEKRDFDGFGKLLHENWKIKRTLSSQISNNAIDEIYELGKSAGALGGKLLGAGAGGFILFFVKPEHQERVKAALSKLLYVPIKFEKEGSQIIFNNGAKTYTS
ncbi:MAG: kinase [Candidatus Paceibacterota bacterium]|jgi:D-glycero-alpha-D-manno-heptose-7-phosphate kinase